MEDSSLVADELRSFPCGIILDHLETKLLFKRDRRGEYVSEKRNCRWYFSGIWSLDWRNLFGKRSPRV